MEWAVGQLVSQDWPVDNGLIQKAAEKRLRSLSETLKSENRGNEASNRSKGLQRLDQRDLQVQLVWDNPAGSLSELELEVKEPSGSVCSLAQKQSPGGGILLGYNLTDKEPNGQYVASQAFAGDYKITVSRFYGQPLGNRARLIITQNAGSKNQSRRIEIIRLDNNLPITLNLKTGRRTDLASIAPAAQQRHRKQASATNDRGAFNDLRAVANPSFYAATTSTTGGAGSPNVLPSRPGSQGFAEQGANGPDRAKLGQPDQRRRGHDHANPHVGRPAQHGYGHPPLLRNGPRQPPRRQPVRHPRRRELVASG